MSRYEEIKKSKDLKAFLKMEYRSDEIIILDTDYAHDKYMEVFYNLQKTFAEDKIPYGTAQKIFKIMDKLNWYGVDDADMCEIFENEDKISLSELNND